MDTDLREPLYMMALSMVPGLSCKNQRLLIDAVGSAGELYANRAELDAVVSRANSKVVEALSHLEEYLPRCEQELEWAERNKISCLTINDEAYPQRLKLCEDAPLVLYYRGTADLNASHIVSMVGTRKISDYGKRLCDSFVRDLSQLVPDVIVMSGLAYGTDVHCHRAALDYGLDTVGVLAHGLDRIYPALHRDTAARIVGHGGLLTEFVSGTGITRYNFLQRNRIVAGCADATIVVESALKGGSLWTASMASSYGREVYAFPGRVTDETSSGCNNLIARNAASLLLDAESFVTSMGWQETHRRSESLRVGVQTEMLHELTSDEERIVGVLRGRERVALSEIAMQTAIPIGRLSGMLFTLEMAGVVQMLPGSMYMLCV